MDAPVTQETKAQLKVGGTMALLMLGLVLIPPVAAIAGGVAIFTAPAVAALGFVPQLGLAVAGGLGIGFLSRIVTTVVSIPLLGYIALKNPALKRAVSEAEGRAEAAAANTNTPAAKADGVKPAAEFKQAAEGTAPVAEQAAEKTPAPKAAPKAAK